MVTVHYNGEAMAYSIEIKAAAVADLLTGEQPAVVAKRYNLPGGLVRKWKFRLGTPDGTLHGTADGTDSLFVDASSASSASSASTQTNTARVVTIRPALEAQQLELGALVLQSLRAKLLATQRIAEYVTTPSWLDKQTAVDMAALFDVLDRSAIAVLDRLARYRVEG